MNIGPYGVAGTLRRTKSRPSEKQNENDRENGTENRVTAHGDLRAQWQRARITTAEMYDEVSSKTRSTA